MTPTQRRLKLYILLLLLVFTWLSALPLSCLQGAYPLKPEQVWSAFLSICDINLTELDHTDATGVLVVVQIRLARACLALISGGALAVSGVVLQGVLRNSLADSFTLGISAGAACGASLFLTGGLAVSFLDGNKSVALATFVGAMIATVATLWLGRGAKDFKKEQIILAGVAVSTFFGALVALIKALNEESVSSIVFWLLGSFQGRGWEEFSLLLSTVLPGLVITSIFWRSLDLFILGDEQSAQMGLAVSKTRLWLLLGASCMTAGCVAVSGIIGFVGLAVPHIFRLLLGATHGGLLVASFFGGGLLLTGADLLARTILDGGQELPVGVVTALIGGPFFALLIRKKS